MLYTLYNIYTYYQSIQLLISIRTTRLGDSLLLRNFGYTRVMSRFTFSRLLSCTQWRLNGFSRHIHFYFRSSVFNMTYDSIVWKQCFDIVLSFFRNNPSRSLYVIWYDRYIANDPYYIIRAFGVGTKIIMYTAGSDGQMRRFLFLIIFQRIHFLSIYRAHKIYRIQ